jgi:hypothetical protein
MAMEPITLFSRIADPTAVARRLRELAPQVQIDGPDASWSNAVVTFGSDRSKRTLTFTHDPEYYAEPGWSEQMSGMRGYFAQLPNTDRKPRVLMLTSTFRFSLGTLFEPDIDPNGDPRLDALFAIAKLLDGVLFTPSSLRDAAGRVLFGAGGEDEEDIDAVWPAVIGEVRASTPAGAAMHEASRPKSAEEGAGGHPPAAARVVRRALALTALTTRAVLERDAAQRVPLVNETYQGLLAWVKAVGIGTEFEPHEWEVLQRPLLKLDSQMQIDSTWRLEGLVVLAWALGRFEIPPHDQLVEMNPLWDSLGWLDVAATKELLAGAALRPRAEIAALRNLLFALHWRLRNFRLKPEVMDFAEFGRTCWFGALDISGLPLVDGDLALRGQRIDRADPEVFSIAQSAAQERHQAANWLWEGPERYSEASVAT